MEKKTLQAYSVPLFSLQPIPSKWTIISYLYSCSLFMLRTQAHLYLFVLSPLVARRVIIPYTLLRN